MDGYELYVIGQSLTWRFPRRGCESLSQRARVGKKEEQNVH
jgi:hypothetical protein